MSLYYDRQGNPIDAETFGELHSANYKRVAEDTVGEAWVSTVWLGIDHTFGSGPPLIFESMIFGGDHDDETWRYCTEEQAKAGHDRIVAALRDGVQP